MRLRSTAGADPLLIDAAATPEPHDAGASLALLEAGDPRIDPLVTAAFDAGDSYVARTRKVRAKLIATAREAGGIDGRLRLAVLSVQGGDEAAILTANLGVVLAQMDGSTTLVDADIEHPSLDRLLRAPNRIGLAEQLAGMPLRLPIAQTAIDRLWLMPTGQSASGMGSLVEKGSLADAADRWNLPMSNLLVLLSERARGGTAFGNVLENFHAVVLVARQGVTPISEIRRVIDDLDRHHVPIAGAVTS